MPGAHAILSASGASRWMACPPSARLESILPEKTSSYADEGTLAHDLGGWLILLKVNKISEQKYQAEFRRIKTSEYYNATLHAYAEDYAMYIFEKFLQLKTDDPYAEIYVETKLDFSKWVPQGFGTGDVVMVARTGMYFFDLKFGVGVPVSAEDNPQLKLYSLGALNEFGHLYRIKTVHMEIYQPRIDNFSEFEMRVEELLDWAENEVAPLAKLAFDGKGEFSAGDHCRFCRARPQCRTLRDYAMGITKYDFLKANLMSDDQIAEVLTKGPAIKSWVEAVKEFALEQALEQGKSWPGFKVVNGRAVRKYTDDVSIANALEAAGYDEESYIDVKLKGVTELEKILTKPKFKEIVGPFVIKPKGAPTLVVLSDKRPVYSAGPSADEVFKDIDLGEDENL